MFNSFRIKLPPPPFFHHTQLANANNNYKNNFINYITALDNTYTLNLNLQHLLLQNTIQPLNYLNHLIHPL